MSLTSDRMITFLSFGFHVKQQGLNKNTFTLLISFDPMLRVFDF